MLNTVADAIAHFGRWAALTGAGISAESGVPTFRGKEGLWGKFRAEELATMDSFMDNPKIVWEWYNWRRKLITEVKPNPGHTAIAELERITESFCLITQNVDGLHRAAGSELILELHGNINDSKCVECGEPFAESSDIDPDDIPSCSDCGGQIRPDVVWFGEMLDDRVIGRALEEAEQAEVFFSIGTSALVHPAASLPLVAKQAGALLIEINPEATPLTELADYSIRQQSGQFLPLLVTRLKELGVGRG
jgi:NAD-dependent deacetylase